MPVNFPFPEPERFALAGDWHGNADFAEAVLRECHARGVDTIVQLGDFGFWPGRRGEVYLERLSKVTQELGVQLLWIDGNHEDFDTLDLLETDESTGLRSLSGNIHHLPRHAGWS